MNTYKHLAPFQLEGGAYIENLSIRYHTYGKLNADKSNVIWICHALTADSDVQHWWPELVGEGKYFDTSIYFVVCANVIGSAYGTTGPLTPQLNQRPLLDKFPLITIRDMVKAHVVLRKHLGIQSIHTLVGASVGGQQALEWAIMEPSTIKNLILIATNAKHSAYGIAFNESQRLAIYADESYGKGNIKGGRNGLIAARSIAMLSYRSYQGYVLTQSNEDQRLHGFKAASYQKYQGQKLANRYNAYSYVTLTNAMDSHDVGRNRGGVIAALRTIKAKTLVVGITSDNLFPTAEQHFLSFNIPNARYEEIESMFGHDGFLIEADALTQSFNRFHNDLFVSDRPNLISINYN